jgi:hypothetical protein
VEDISEPRDVSGIANEKNDAKEPEHVPRYNLRSTKYYDDGDHTWKYGLHNMTVTTAIKNYGNKAVESVKAEIRQVSLKSLASGRKTIRCALQK